MSEVTPPASSFPTRGWHQVVVERYDSPPPVEYRAGCLDCRWTGAYHREERDADAQASSHENPAHRSRGDDR